MEHRKRYIAVAIFLAAWGLAQFFIARFEIRFPGADIYQFKLPGIELATRGTLTAVNLPNTKQDTRMVYAFYPPLFPVLYGLWVKCFGTSYSASILFDGVWRLLRVVLILAWVHRLSHDGLFRNHIRFFLVLFMAWIFAWFPNNEDRPDEMGFFLAFAALYWSIFRGRLFAGVLLGLSASASPTAGLFGAVLQMMWWSKRDLKRLILIGSLSLVAFFLTVLPVWIFDHTVIERFLIGVRYNALPYANRSEHARMGQTGIYSFFFHLKQSFAMGRAMFWCLGTLLLVTPLTRSLRSPEQRRIFLSAILFAAISIAIFSIEPLYLWFSCCLIITILLSQLLDSPDRGRTICISLGLLASMAPMALRETKLILDGVQRPRSQTISGAGEILAPLIESGFRVAAGADNFFTAGAGQTDNIVFVCSFVHRAYDYAWLSESVTFSNINGRSPASPVSSLCYWTPQCFRLVKDYRPTQRSSIFGLKTPYFNRGYGGVLYRNTCKETGIYLPR